MTIHLFASGDRIKTIAGVLALAATVVIAAPTAARAADPPRTAALYEGIGMGDQPSKRVRTLQREYVELWADRLRAAHQDLEPDRARAMSHAAFGLINSTPHSGLLPDGDMSLLLREMALHSLGIQAGPPTA